MNTQATSKIYWRCRRGMAELDVLLQAFLDSDYQNLGAEERESFEQLLANNDTQLLEYLMGRTVPSESGLKDIVTRIRQAVLSI